MKRRTFLASAGVFGATALTGCSALNETDDETAPTRLAEVGGWNRDSNIDPYDLFVKIEQEGRVLLMEVFEIEASDDENIFLYRPPEPTQGEFTITAKLNAWIYANQLPSDLPYGYAKAVRRHFSKPWCYGNITLRVEEGLILIDSGSNQPQMCGGNAGNTTRTNTPD